MADVEICDDGWRVIDIFVFIRQILQLVSAGISGILVQLCCGKLENSGIFGTNIYLCYFITNNILIFILEFV